MSWLVLLLVFCQGFVCYSLKRFPLKIRVRICAEQYNSISISLG
jgi:hypothetical protein